MKMPSLKALHSHRSSTPSQLFVADSRSAVWTRSNTDDVSLSQLHKFWTGLSSTARRELLRIDKQALFEQVRKNLYCSRCHGLLVEGYAQIVSYGRNLQAGLLGYGNGSGACGKHISDVGTTNGANISLQDDTRDPSVHPWGGLAATRDSMLTVLDCFLDGTPLEVFESARARERERELLYPDACGGGGRGWISQGSGSFGGNGRGHGMKETCALHTARLSCEALVDFWSALGEETRRSLLRMKEEDFIERLMFRFDSKRFCRDCRRNVLREFKEMKELKRTRKEPRCTQWFCAADTAFRYEVSDTKVHVDWRDSFSGDGGSLYQRFDWGLGTAQGKADILNFQDVGLSNSIRAEGLDLGNTAVCFIMVRGWKRDGRCTELTAKAHALKGQLCVHRRLIVGDGYVSITKGESIQQFFERAEETEEEEDDDTMDKDGNEIDGEGSRPQRHAKSPELARDFLLDAATVIFKEQVEKAFREGTARQNAHSIFVCLALSLLEERVRVACKEITTLEKQNKLLEEEEDEKREEEERRERRKLKEKEKKLRRKEKLKEKEREKGKCKSLAKTILNGSVSGDAFHIDDVGRGVAGHVEVDSRNDMDSISARPPSPDMAEARPSVDGAGIENGALICLKSSSPDDIEVSLSMRDGNGAFLVERTKSSKRRVQGRQPHISEGEFNGQPRGENLDLEGSEQSFARLVQPSIAVKAQTIQVCSKKCGQDTDNLSKRMDSWHRSVGQAQHKLDEVQSCACGGPQTNPRLKGGHRNVIRAGIKDPPSKVAEKVEHGMKGVSKNIGADFGNPHDKPDGVKGKLFFPTTAKRKGERDHENVITGGMAKQSLSRSASAGNLNEGIRKNDVLLANSDGMPGKTLGITSSSNTTANPGCGSFGDAFTSQKSGKGVSTRVAARAKPTGGTYVGKLAVPENDVRPVTDDIRGPHESHSASNPLLVGCTVCTNGTNATSHLVHERNDPPNQTAISPTGDFVAKKADQAVNHNEHVKLVSKGADAEKKLASDEGTNFSSMVGDNSVPSGILSSVLGASQNSRLTVAKDVVAIKASIRAVQFPTLIPQPPVHVHPSASFGYYQGSWGATRSRSAVLPLPPAGGFLIPGPTTLGPPMGCLAPVALSQDVASVVEAGCRSTLPSGGNTLQLRESVYLPRFGGNSGGETEGKKCASHNPVSATVGEETVSVMRGMDGQFTPVEVEAGASASSCTVQKDHGSDSVQPETNVFSLFHFSGPAVVAQKEVDSSAVGPPPKESSLDKVPDGPAEAGMGSNTKEGTGSAVNASTTAGEYSLFAKAGTGLVFFQGH